MPSRAELERFRGAGVDEVLGVEVRLLLVGINPGLWTAAVNAPFARPGNRFWPALHRAGLTPRAVDASRGLDPVDARQLTDRGIGITNIVNVATARADELSPVQLREGGARLRETVRRLRPRVVAVLGLTSYRHAFDDRAARIGRQDVRLEGAELWVLPNPSGLNAHETVDSLAEWYRRAAQAAGIDL